MRAIAASSLSFGGCGGQSQKYKSTYFGHFRLPEQHDDLGGHGAHYVKK